MKCYAVLKFVRNIFLKIHFYILLDQPSRKQNVIKSSKNLQINAESLFGHKFLKNLNGCICKSFASATFKEAKFCNTYL
jgi:hypothetical protein